MDLIPFYASSILRKTEIIKETFNFEDNIEIPRITKFFKTFDPVNFDFTKKKLQKNDIIKIDSYNEIEQIIINLTHELHLQTYLNHSMFKLKTLKETPIKKVYVSIMNPYDCVFHAIISYMLLWPQENLIDFGKKYNFSDFINFFFDEINLIDIFFHKNEEIYFIQTSIKLFSKYFQRNSFYDIRTTINYSPLKIINENLKQEMSNFLEKLFSNTFKSNDIKSIESSHLYHSYATLPKNKIKYITGQACVGKSTLLKNLEKMNWVILSRSDIGTFSGKSKNAVEIANLYESLSYALARENVIGDRGNIDNPGWYFIMDNLIYNSKEELIEKCIFFFETNFNEYSVLSYASQKVIIIIDLKAELNRRRMFQRSESGDLQRARIWMYPYTQAFFYFVAARVFGWKIFCTPYDVNNTFCPDNYDILYDYVSYHFGIPSLDFHTNLNVSKPKGEYKSNHEFAKNCGIYK